MSESGTTPRLRLHAIRIQDFRGVQDLALNLRRGDRALDVVLLAGDNGAGKTSVLEAILMVLGQGSLLPTDAAPLAEQTRFGSASFTIDANVSPPVSEKLRLRQLTFNPSVPANPTAMFTAWGGEIGRGDNGPFWAKIRELAPEVEYFSARREPEALGENSGPRGARSSEEARRVVELKRRLRSAYVRQLREKSAGRDSANDPFERVQRFWRRFNESGWVLDVIPVSNNPGSDDEVVLREPRPVPSDVTSLAMARELAPSRPDIPNMVPLDRLSSGEVALMAFAGPLIFRDRPADVVVIDEPEQHLHPQWQRHLLRALRELSPASQFIVATHSVPMLESALSDERFMLFRQGDPRGETSEASPTQAGS